jgi:hypothetical protein
MRKRCGRRCYGHRQTSAFIDAVFLGIPKANRGMREMRIGTVMRGVPIVGGSVPCLHRNQARMVAAMTNSGELLRSSLAANWVEIWVEIERGSRGRL